MRPLLILLLLAPALRADIAPLPVAVDDTGHLVPLCAETFALVPLPWSAGHFAWEGRSSTLTVTHDDQSVTLAFKFDIIGPDWLNVELTDDGTDIYLHGWICGSDSEPRKDFYGAWSTWDELLRDPSPEAGAVRWSLYRAECNERLEHVTR